MDLRCASCDVVNDSAARFCSACGAALYAACPSCGSEQPASAAFCSSCGTRLRADAGRPPRADERQERRVVTVVFADLAGSTALGERLDPEDVRELQAELFDVVNTQVERFGGVTEKFVGDAVLAVFGIPAAHEDDPERAVRTALATQKAFAPLAARVHERFGIDVALRVGVNTGEVVAGREAAARGELMVSGDAVNVAARLQQAAEPGQVLVGDRTRSATSRSVAYGERTRIDAKGKRDAVTAWPAESATLEPAPRGFGGLSAPLIARADELAILTAVARRVVRERAPQLVTILGPAGVGKSRLLQELVLRIPGSTLLEGRCLPYGDDVTYRAIAEAAREHAGVLESDPAVTVRDKLRADLDRVVGADADQVLAPLLWTIGLDVPEGGTSSAHVSQALAAAWRRYLTGLGQIEPTVIAIEDVHWASPPLLDLIDHLADALTDTPVLIVCTSRLELLETRPTWGAGKQNATSLTLGPLAADDAEELVNALVGGTAARGAFGRRVLARAEGNPFFIEEMLAMLVERGALVHADGGWQVRDDLDEVPLPDSVHGVIAARLDLLDHESRDALRRSSVAGRVFWPAAVGASDEAIAPLAGRGLVSERRSLIAGVREFAFKHALTRDVAYGSLPRAERRALHRRVAEWIQDVAPDRGLEAAELAAHHYGEALAYGEDDETVAARAAEVSLTAGEGALRRGALDAAARHLDRVLELTSAHDLRASALVGLAELALLRSEAGVAESLATAERHLRSALETLPPEAVELRSNALAWQSRIHWLSGRWEEALAAATDAVEALRGLPDSPQLARALARRSQLAMLRDTAGAATLTREALAVAQRVGDRFATINASINVMSVDALDGVAPDPPRVLELITDARDTGANEEAYRALVNFVWSAAGYVPMDAVLDVLEKGEALLADTPRPGGLGEYLPLSVALVHLLPAGRFDDVDEILARTDTDDLNATSRMLWLGVCAQLLTRRGDLPGASSLLDELLPLAVETGEPQRVIPMACAYLPWAALTGEHDRLRTVASRVLDLVDDRWAATLTALPLVRALATANELEHVARYAASFRRAPRPPVGRLATTLAAAEGAIAMGEGRYEDAVERLTGAVDTSRALGYAFDAATVELDLAAALERGGQLDRAAAVRAAARSVFASVGCTNPI
jgi:class 3 adenylate cyclase/tetratricopeptide (TPR) repeat protein